MDILKSKGAVVTGAASGIGKAIAAAFIEAGARVLLCDLNEKALDAATRELGDRAIGRVTDVSDETQVEGAMCAAREDPPRQRRGCPDPPKSGAPFRL